MGLLVTTSQPPEQSLLRRSCRTTRWASCARQASCGTTCPLPARMGRQQTGAAWTLQPSACGNASTPGIESPRSALSCVSGLHATWPCT